MDFPDLLGIYAELAIGLAGFGGVAAAFSGRERQFTVGDSMRLNALLLSAGSVLVGCFGYYVVWVAGKSDSTSIMGAASCSLPITLIYAATIVPRAWRAGFDPTTTTSLLVVSTFSVLTALMILAYVGVLVGGGEPALLIAGFSIQLGFGLWLFARLLTRPN